MAAPDVSSKSLADLISLAGRNALVTGGGKGIGAAVARRLAEAGAGVMVADIDKAAAEQVAGEIGEAARSNGGCSGPGSGGRAIGVELDVTDSAAVEAVVGRATAELGGLDILVNNAGIFPIFPVLALPDEEWDRVLRTNLYGAFYCAREAGRQMVGRGGVLPGGQVKPQSVIVNVASIQAFRAGSPGLAAYTSSKGALVSLTRALAVELGPMGVRVLAVAPTVVDTPGLQANMPIFEAAGVADVIGEVSAKLPLGRTAVPDDVARVVLFCASDLAALMTGDTLLVDAGHLTV
jgi:NAD(P)-dependent dehydrogenase (short-subunit alcohol dehydrogenase family)